MGFERAGVDAGAAVGAPTLSLAETASGTADRVGRIYGDIHRAVVEQRLPPGTKLPEDQLGQHFGVSRTLVRGALLALSRDGIVVLARNRGAAVASPGPAEARELFEARRIVETVTVARAAAQAGDGDLLALDALLAAGQDALHDGDRGRAIRLSGQFHILIAEIARQSVLRGFLTELVARSSLVIALYGHRGRSDCGDAEHRALIEALRSRDEVRAMDLMTEHLNHIEADLDLDRQSRPALPLARLLAGEPVR